MHTYTHIQAHSHAHTYTHMYAHIRMHTHMHAHMHMHTSTCIYTITHTHTLNEMSHKESQIPYNLIYMQNLKVTPKRKKHIYKQRIDRWLPEVGDGVGRKVKRVQSTNFYL